MPKSKRNRTVHMTQVSKKTREHKDKLLENIRDAIPDYQHIFVFSIENMRNTHLQELRKELNDSKYVYTHNISLSLSVSSLLASGALARSSFSLSPLCPCTMNAPATDKSPPCAPSSPESSSARRRS